MSKQRRDCILFIEDILTCIEKIERYTGNVSFEEFCGNDMAVDAVIRNFEIIGEAVKKVPEDNMKKHQKEDQRMIDTTLVTDYPSQITPNVSIIILNWNGWQDTIECLESLYLITYPDYDRR